MTEYRFSYCAVVILVSSVTANFAFEVYDETSPKFNLHSSDFAEIVSTTSFVDKTLFIKTFVEDHGTVVITAPHHFGRSTNLNMVKRFLEIEVDDEGIKKTKNKNIRLPIQDTENYNLFVDNKLKITENKTFMDYHFGKHPVIFVDFEFDNIHIMSYDIAVDQIKYIIHRTYVEHHYLIKSDRLNSDEKSVLKNWCSTSVYSRMTEEDISDSLRLLSRFLYRHYENRKVYVLIDNFDSPVVNAILFAITEDIMGGIYRLLSSVIIKVLQKNFHAHRGLISGVSYIAGSPALYRLGYVSVCRFLENHSYAGLHGFTEEETSDIFSRQVFNLSSTKISKAKAFYGGYNSCGNLTLYDPWSVIHFLLTQEVRSYWKGPGVVFNLENLLKVPLLRKDITCLSKGKERKVSVKKIYAPDDVIRLRDLIRRPDLHMELHNSDVVLTFLLELGYLNYVPAEQSFISNKLVKIPNKEMRDEFYRHVNSYDKSYGPMKSHYR